MPASAPIAANDKPTAKTSQVPTASTPASPDLLFLFLKSVDANCPTCQYNCRGLHEPRCPECGRELTLMLGASEPHVLPWTLFVIFIAMAASVGVLVGGFAGSNGLYVVRFLVKSHDIARLLGIAYGIIAVPLLFVIVLWRRRFFTLSRQQQWLLAAGALAINVGLVIIALVIR